MKGSLIDKELTVHQKRHFNYIVSHALNALKSDKSSKKKLMDNLTCFCKNQNFSFFLHFV